MTQSESLLTVEEVANYVKLHVETVRRLIREGKIPALRIGGRWRVHKNDLEKRGKQNAPGNKRQKANKPI